MIGDVGVASAARRRAAGFALLALVTELTGRSITSGSTAPSTSCRSRRRRPRYYPFLLAGVRVARGARARAASPGASCGRTRPRSPRERLLGSDRAAPRRRAAAPAAALAAALARSRSARPRSGTSLQNDADAARRGPLAAARAVAAHLRAAGLRRARDPARDRLGRGPRLARRGRGLRRGDLRARLPHPARRAGSGPSPPAASRRPRAAPPVRPRLRVAAASTPRLTRGASHRPRVVVSSRRLEGEGGNTSSSHADRRPRPTAHPRARAISLLGPLTVVGGRRLGDRSSRTGSRCCTRTTRASGGS